MQCSTYNDSHFRKPCSHGSAGGPDPDTFADLVKRRTGRKVTKED